LFVEQLLRDGECGRSIFQLGPSSSENDASAADDVAEWFVRGPVVGTVIRGAVFIVRECLGFRRGAHGRRVVAGGDVSILTVGSHSQDRVMGSVASTEMTSGSIR
jgi:hypothetical protein